MRAWYQITPADGPGHEKGAKLKADHEAIMQAKDNQPVITLEKSWSQDGAYDENLQNTDGQETLCANLAHGLQPVYTGCQQIVDNV